MRRSSEYLEEGYDGASYRVQNLTVSKLRRHHFFRTEYSVGIPIDSTTILVPPTY